MDELFQKKLKEDQKKHVNSANETNDQFAERYAKVNETMKTNLQEVRTFVDQKVFDGDMDKQAQLNKLDYNHDFIFTDVKQNVFSANRQVYNNIKKYGKAEPTAEDKKKKLDIKGFFKTFSNKCVEKFKGKEASFQTALLETAREQNENVDKTTAYELSKLINYSDEIAKYLDLKNKGGIIAKGSLYNELVKKHLDKVPRTQKKKEEDRLYNKLRFKMLPFMKMYKTKWFFGTKYYNLDGKRLKTKDGELNPEDYNKALVEAFMLDTDADKVKDAKTLKKNREKKAAVLSRITKEMIEYGRKFDPTKMTDLYVANHIIELQEYYARLNAFQDLVTDNQWFFMGKEDVKKESKKLLMTPAEQINASLDPDFANLVKTHILDMRFPISNFLEAHMRSHCLQVNMNFKNREHYFRTDEKLPIVVVGEEEDEIDDLKFEDRADLDEMNADLNDAKERNERFKAFGQEFNVVDMSKMDVVEAKRYKERLKKERDDWKNGATGQRLANSLRKIRYRQTYMASKDVTTIIKPQLDTLKKNAAEDVQAWNKEQKKEKDKFIEIPYASPLGGELAETVYVDINFIHDKMRSETGTVMYMHFEPEIKHIYGKLYTAIRLQAEYCARKKAIDQKFKFSEIHELKKGLKKKNVAKPLRKSWQDQLDKLNKENLKAAKDASKTKNAYVKFSEDILASTRLQRAEQEYDEIAKKLEYTMAQIAVCSKTLRFFLSDPTQELFVRDGDYPIIEKFLKKEKLDYMYNVNKIDGFDKVLDEALEDTEKDLQAEAGKDKKIQPLKRRDKNPRARSARINEVRRRGRVAVNMEQAQRERIGEFTDSDAEFDKLVMMKPEELSGFNYKGEIPVGTKEERKRMMDNVALLNRVISREGKFNPSFYTKNKNMFPLFRKYKQMGLYPRSYSFSKFKNEVRVKIEMLYKWNNYFVNQFINQTDNDYLYLDTEVLQGMSIHALELLYNNLSEKAEQYKKEADEIAKQLGRKGAKKNKKEEENNQIVIINEEKQEDDKDTKSLVYRYRKNKEDNCRVLMKAIKRKIAMQKSADNYVEFSSEAYYRELDYLNLEDDIDYATSEQYPMADRTYLVLRKYSDTVQARKYALSSLDYRIKEKKVKDPKYLDDAKNIEAEAIELLVRLREIKIGPEFVELVERLLKKRSTVPTEEELSTLLSYATAINDAKFVLQADPAFSDKEYLAIRDYFYKEENKQLLDELKEKYELLKPFYTAFDHFGQAYDLSSLRVFSMTDAYATEKNKIRDDKKLSADEKKAKIEELDSKIRDTYYKELQDCDEACDELFDNLKKAEEKQQKEQADSMKKLFALVAEGGEKLDLSKMEEWKKILETIKDKGYYKKAPEKGKEGDKVWMKAAASHALFLWPHSFEDFVAERAKLDTGKALDVTLKEKTNADIKSFSKDPAHAADISATITKKQQFVYNSLPQDLHKELDENLVRSGYDPKIFKYIFEDVEVNGAGLPINAEESQKRFSNRVLALDFIKRNQKAEAGKEEPKITWQNTAIKELVKGAEFEIKKEMLEPAYIKKHFAYLYGKTRKFAALKQIYDHEKDILDDPEILKRNGFNANQAKSVHNAFGPQVRSMYAMFFEMIEAYAQTYFVNKEGRFDFGLTNEEINGKAGQEIDKEANKEKLHKIQQERDDYFKRMTRRVASEIERNDLAKQVAKADEINNTLDVIQVQGDEQVVKIARKKEFSGIITDFNFLMYNPEHAKKVQMYNEGNAAVEEVEKQIKPLRDEYDKLVAEGKKDEPAAVELKAKIEMINAGMAPFKMQIGEAEFYIKERQKEHKIVYERYNECHKKDGSLNIIEKLEDGSTRNQIAKYVEFQSLVSKNCAEVYRELKKFFGDKKNLTKDTFTADTIVKQFRSSEMVEKLRNLRQIDLYLSLFEVDKKGFKTGGSDVMKQMNDYVEQLTKQRNKWPENSGDPLQDSYRSMLTNQINDTDNARKFMLEVMKDMEAGENGPIRLIHDYVRLVFLTLKSYGVTLSGEIEDVKIGEDVKDKLTEQQIKNVAYEEADKIGDAHLELQHELNRRLGFEENPQAKTKAKPKTKPKEKAKEKEKPKAAVKSTKKAEPKATEKTTKKAEPKATEKKKGKGGK